MSEARKCGREIKKRDACGSESSYHPGQGLRLDLQYVSCHAAPFDEAVLHFCHRTPRTCAQRLVNNRRHNLGIGIAKTEGSRITWPARGGFVIDARITFGQEHEQTIIESIRWLLAFSHSNVHVAKARSSSIDCSPVCSIRDSIGSRCGVVSGSDDVLDYVDAGNPFNTLRNRLHVWPKYFKRILIHRFLAKHWFPVRTQTPSSLIRGGRRTILRENMC